MRASVLYNAEGDGAAVDAASVEGAARAVAGALRDAGHAVELVAIRGAEVHATLVAVRARGVDLAFNLCEAIAGDTRNEPTFAGLLDLLAIPYTGADLPALAACLYKPRTKDILAGRRVPTPPHVTIDDAAALADPALDALDYPWFVKLAREDASVGITEDNVVRSPAALRARASELLRAYRQPVLAERYVDGREINATLVGNGDDLALLPLHEIDFAAMPAERPRIVSYAAKWDPDHVDYVGTKPVPLRAATGELHAAIDRVARAAWHALGLRDYGRVDLRVDAAGVPWVIDVNPNPDLSPDAGVARAAAAAGWSYGALVERIASAARKRTTG